MAKPKQRSVYTRREIARIVLPTCDDCGQSFVPTGVNQRFCSDYCRIKHWYAEKKRRASQEQAE